MGHNSAVSGHPIFTSFSQVNGWLTDPWVLGRHSPKHICLSPTMCIYTSSTIIKYCIYISKTYIRWTPNVVLALANTGCL